MESPEPLLSFVWRHALSLATEGGTKADASYFKAGIRDREDAKQREVT